MGILAGSFQHSYCRSHCANAPFIDSVLGDDQEAGDIEDLIPPRRIGQFAGIGFLPLSGDNKFLTVAAARLDEDAALGANDLGTVVSRAILGSRTLADKIRVFQSQDTAGVDAVGVAVRVIVDGFRVAKSPTTK